MLLGSMNSCSALFPNVSFFYKKSLLSPHFYLAVVAPAGAGKGALGFTSILLDATQEFYDRLRREQKRNTIRNYWPGSRNSSRPGTPNACPTST